MPPLHATPALPATAVVDAEAARDGPHGRYVLLVLIGNAVLVDLASAAGVRAAPGERRVVVLVHAARARAEGALAVGLAGLAARALRVPLRLALREGRGLPLPCTREIIDLAAEPGHLGLEGLDARAVVALRAAHLVLDLRGVSRTISADAAPG